MKKIYTVVFLIVLSINTIIRLMVTAPREQYGEPARIFTVYVVILPFFCAFLSSFLIKSIPKAVIVNLAALIVSAVITMLYTAANPPLSEFFWLITQIPSFLISFLAAHIVRAAKTLRGKMLCLLPFLAAIGIAFSAFYSFLRIMTGMAASAQ